jgi:hypothetical protein
VVKRARDHLRRLWPGIGVLAPIPFVAWCIFRLAGGEVRWDLLGFLVVPPVLAYTSKATKRLFVGTYPLGLVAVLYDAMRYVQNVGVSPSRVHICDLRATEMRLFGIEWNGQRTTVHDFIQAHTIPALDLYFAIPYATFLFAYIGFAVWLWRKDFAALQRFGWAFFVVNVLGFVTYHLYPAAPPWYFHAHGCVVDMAAHASEGPALARVDAWLGVPYFHGMYARASDIYGAVPSLHCAYPLLIALFGWPLMRAAGRIAAVVFAVSMCCGAVYLDHHWVLDVVLGLTYGLVTYFVVTYAYGVVVARRAADGDAEAVPAAARAPAPAPAPGGSAP